MTRFAVEWEAIYPPEFGGGQGWVVAADAARRAEAERDRYREALEEIERDLCYDSEWTHERLIAAVDDAYKRVAVALEQP